MNLMVFLNGQLMQEGWDYKEIPQVREDFTWVLARLGLCKSGETVTGTKLKFNFGVQPGDWIQIN